MKKIVYVVILGVFLFSCNNSEKTMNLSGTVKGLKKGTLYLQKIIDSSLTTLDSLEVKGKGDFLFEITVENPEIFYLYLKKEDNNTINDRITFFGEPGNITINTSWNTFDANAKIEGSKSTKKLKEYRNMLSEFNKKSLIYASIVNNSKTEYTVKALDSIQQLYNKNIVNSYRYTINFALNNTDSYAVPYIAVTEIPDANVKYLDSIHKSLIPAVANSTYGKKLKAHIEAVKAK